MATPTAAIPHLADAALRARGAMADQDLCGWDPYDALLAPAFRLPVLRSRWLPRFAAQQVVLRSPVNLRPLLRVPPQRNAVTVALYAQGLSDLTVAGLVPVAGARIEVARCVALLEQLVSPGMHGCAWGYPFPWEGRRHRMPANHPTVVATGIVVNGLHHAWRTLGVEDARRLVVGSAAFVLDDLPRAAGDDRSWCWAYSPTDRQAVLNATMKGTRLLAQAVDAGLDDARALPAALASARFVAEHQDSDGGWRYAVAGDPRTWRDHFHTAYILECYNTYRRLTADSRFDDTIARGWEHYRTVFFTEGDLPRYYDTQDGPLDATAVGQALLTLPAFGAENLGLRVAAATVPLLSQPDGSFAYQRTGRRTTRTHFMRWSTAWMFAGLARVLARSAA